jgi:hypothetical protein
MKEFISLLLNTMIYPLFFCLVFFIFVEIIAFFDQKKFLKMNHTKKGFYFILFSTIIFWTLIISIVKWLI